MAVEIVYSVYRGIRGTAEIRGETIRVKESGDKQDKTYITEKSSRIA